MKTSSSQFDFMVTFMEQHGDLSKPSSNARGRMNFIKKWEELTNLLNSDGSGTTKTTERWKKVWSDLKNNTKKKSARLNKAAQATGGGPATYAKLSDLELRVLNMVGKQVATGLAVEEVGLSQVNQIQPHASLEQRTPTPLSHQFIGNPQPPNEPGPITPLQCSTLPPSQAVTVPSLAIENAVQSSQPWNEPGPSTQLHTTPPLSPSWVRPAASPPTPVAFVEVEVEIADTPTSPRPSSRVHVARPEPTLFGQTTPRRRRQLQTRGSPRRYMRPTQTEQVSQHFLQADENWRNFRIQQHQDYMDMRREQNRLRDMEVQAQREWQAVGIRALDILEKFVNKYCKD